MGWRSAACRAGRQAEVLWHAGKKRGAPGRALRAGVKKVEEKRVKSGGHRAGARGLAPRGAILRSESRAHGGYLGSQRRRRARQAAIICGEAQIAVDPRVPEWGNPPARAGIPVYREANPGN